MAVITYDNRAAWQDMADRASEQFPNVGKRVEVVGGRKHKGKSGIVRYHGANKFYDIRYKSEAQLMFMDIVGREGFVVQIETDDGEKFFVPAQYVTVFNK